MRSFAFSLIIISALFGTLSFGASSAHAYDPPDPPAQSFASTENIETDSGPAHLEVQSFEVKSDVDLKSAELQLLEKIRQDSKTSVLYKLKVKVDNSGEVEQPALEKAADETVARISGSLNAEVVQVPKTITVSKPEYFFKRHYNLTLTVVRFFANSATVSTGLLIGKHVPLTHATMIGILAGTLSGAVQLHSDKVFKWLSNSVLLTNTARKMGLIQDTDNPQTAERILREVETYGRWAALEAAFLLVCRTGMSLLNIPVTENLFLTVGKSTASQGIYEIGILKATRALEQINPQWTERAAIFKNSALFGGSALSVLSAIGSMIEMPYSNLGFAILTGTGLVLNFSPKLLRLKPVEKILERWRPSPKVIQCRSLFAA